MNRYANTYRKLHPRQFPYSSFEKQHELHDLWPDEQQRFERSVDKIIEAGSNVS